MAAVIIVLLVLAILAGSYYYLSLAKSLPPAARPRTERLFRDLAIVGSLRVTVPRDSSSVSKHIGTGKRVATKTCPDA